MNFREHAGVPAGSAVIVVDRKLSAVATAEVGRTDLGILPEKSYASIAELITRLRH